MSHLISALLLYLALVAQVAARFGGAGGWTPNLMLAVGLAAAERVRGGIVWAATAGLACDALTGRPLGVTMLAATLTAAVMRPPAGASRRGTRVRNVFRVAVGVFVVEAAARVLTSTVVAKPDHAAELIAALRIASSTLGACLVGILCGCVARVVGRSHDSSYAASSLPRAARR